MRARVGEKRAAANRRNAKRSTGPRSEEGKRRSSQNARRHGLSVPSVHSDSSVDAIEQFVTALLSGYSRQQDELRPVARLLAAAEAELARIRSVRRDLFRSMDTDNTVRAPGEVSKIATALDNISKLSRYEKGARSRREKAIRKWLLTLEGYGSDNRDVLMSALRQ